MTDRTGEAQAMERTPTSIGVLATLAVPSVASAGNVTAQAKKLQVASAQHLSARALGTKIVPLGKRH